MIQLSHVQLGYGSQQVLDDICLDLPEKGLVCILGRNGSGKSTFLKACAGLLKPHAGQILLDGISLDALPARVRAQKIAWMPQSRNIAQCTLFQMVLHGRFPYLHFPRRYSQKDKELVLQALDRFHLLPLKDRMLEHVSGGQRQLAYLAMALVQESGYIFLDEPLVYLDLDVQLDFMHQLEEIKKEPRTILAILHDLELALEFGDAFLIMDDHKVWQFENRQALLASGLLEKVFGCRAVQVKIDGKDRTILTHL